MTREKILRSHSVNSLSLQTIVNEKAVKIQNSKETAANVEKELEILKALTQFELGRFLLQNRGLNGYWTHYILTYPWDNWNKPAAKELTPLEKVLLKTPIFKATQERFEIFLAENQKAVRNGAVLASVPCGMFGELLYLDFDGVDQIQLVGIDYDKNTFEDAKKLAAELNLLSFTNFVERDAWHLNIENTFDLISSNGLNVYEPDNEKVVLLYKEFFKALKPEGQLVTSFLTYPRELTSHCEWNFAEINSEALNLQKLVFGKIIGVQWQSYRSSDQTHAQLSEAGFTNIRFIYDRARMFPTVVAEKE